MSEPSVQDAIDLVNDRHKHSQKHINELYRKQDLLVQDFDNFKLSLSDKIQIAVDARIEDKLNKVVEVITMSVQQKSELKFLRWGLGIFVSVAVGLAVYIVKQ